MKKAFYTFISLLIWLNSNSQILHLVVVADITDKTFGTVSSNDITTIESLFSTSATYIDHKFQPIFLTNASFNSNSVKNAINKLKTQPNDMIVFYYSGYGFYQAKSKSEFPTFKFDVAQKDILSLDEVGNLINQKGVRLGLAIADCREEKAEYRQAYPPFIGESFLKLAYQKVFLESCGLIKVAASSKGYKNTILDDGSAFIKGLSKALGNLYLVELNDIDELNLIKILNDTQKDIDLALGKPIQKMIWKKDVCGDSQKSLSRKFPSYKNAPTMLGLSNNLDFLIKTKTASKRISTIQQIQFAFANDAKITVHTVRSNDYERVNTTNYSVAQFIDHLKNLNSNIIEFKMEPEDLKRTLDYQKYTQATFTKVLNQ